MERKHPHEVTSSCRIMYSYFGKDGKLEFAYTSFFENPILMARLFSYHEQLGVDAYEQDHNGVAWSIQKNWYTTDQIERMLSLKAFM